MKILNNNKKVIWKDSGKNTEAIITGNDSETCEVNENGNLLDLNYFIKTINGSFMVHNTEIQEIEPNEQLILIEDKKQFDMIVNMLNVLNIDNKLMYGYKAMIREEAKIKVDSKLSTLEVDVSEPLYHSMLNELQYKFMEEEILDTGYIDSLTSEVVNSHLN